MSLCITDPCFLADTGERPFHCLQCEAGFQRPDVLAKHVQKLHPQVVPRTDSSATTLPASTRKLTPRARERARLACDQCRKRKLKCDNTLPCESCRSKSLDCVVSSSSRPPGRPRNAPILTSPVELSTISTSSPSNAPCEPTYDVEPSPQPALEQWTTPCPGDIHQGWRTHTSATGNSNESISDPTVTCREVHFSSGDLAMPGVDGWMSPSFTCTATGQGPVVAPEISFPESAERMGFLDDILPSAVSITYELDKLMRLLRLMTQDFGSWLGELNEFPITDDIWPQRTDVCDVDVDRSMQGAIDMVRDQMRRRSRASSPTREAQRRAWYSATPQLDVYDSEVLNILLNVAKKHLAPTLAIFDNFRAHDDTSIELCLAMAAVGALYSSVPGSSKIAIMLYNDSRRLLLENYLRVDKVMFQQYLGFAKTFILLEIYGLCSGDRRAYEFLEVFHGNKVHAATTCIRSLPHDCTAEQKRQAMRLSEAMHVLDSYRVILVQRPPAFAGEFLLGTGTDNHIFRSNGAHLFTPTLCTMGLFSGDMHHLAKVIRYCWMAGPCDPDNSNPVQLWRPEFVELALDQWIQSKTAITPSLGEAEAPQMLLYHLAHVYLQTNMGLLSILTHATFQSASKGSPKSQADKPSGQMVNPWLTRRQFDIALWHAKTMLKIAHEIIRSPRKGTLVDPLRILTSEPPHLPLSVYFATLVVWFGEAKWDKIDVASGDKAIEEGSQALFKMKVPVAKLLGTALCELLSV